MPEHPDKSKPVLFTAPTEIFSELEWRMAGEILRTALRPNLNAEIFLNCRPQLMADGYRLAAIFHEGKMASVGSFTISPHAELRRELLIHDMATHPHFERRGLGSSLLKYLDTVAVSEGCGRVFVHTRRMTSFYVNNGCKEHSTGLIKRLDG